MVCYVAVHDESHAGKGPGKKGVKALSDENTLPDIQVSTGLTLGGLGAGLLAGLAAESGRG
jgi:hypothetical protein